MKRNAEHERMIQNYQRTRKHASLPRMFFVFVLGLLLVVSLGYAASKEITNPPEFSYALQPYQTVTPSPITEQPQAPAEQRAVSTPASPSPTVPDYKATNQALEKTQKAVNNQMNTATAEAEYYSLMLLKSEVENEIENNEFEQQISHTGTAEASAAIATRTQQVYEQELEILYLQQTKESDSVATEIERNDYDTERYNRIRNTLIILLQFTLLGISVLLILFVRAILKKAFKQMQWEMDREKEFQQEHDAQKTAQIVSNILEQEQKEKHYVSELIAAIGKIEGLEGSIIPRYDKLQQFISQSNRDYAVSVLEKYNLIFPVKQGSSTELRQGTFAELREDLRAGNFPPSPLVHQRLKNRYTQQLTEVNSNQQDSTVEKIATGVYKSK